MGIRTFEKQIRLLKERFNVISFEHLYHLLINRKPIAPKTVVLTIDDGYEDFYLYAFPILQKHSVPATIYVVTDFVEQKTWLWPDSLEYLLKNTSITAYSAHLAEHSTTYRLTDMQARMKAWSDIADFCLTLPNKTKLDFITDLATDLKVSLPELPTDEYRSLSWQRLRHLIDCGLIHVGSHTVTHPKLTMVETHDELKYEIKNSKWIIEDRLDKEVTSFCYPNGTPADVNYDVKALVREAGYTNAVVGYFDLACFSDIFEMRRCEASKSMLEFQKVVYNIDVISHLFKTRINFSRSI
jgi:peptidoglycan/xylan/chitin deacetylase (PgdA/CDA1 family)